MPLHVEVQGSGPPLVLLHGFTQTARLWGLFGELLVESHTLVGIDLPGHAGSDAERADLPGSADLVADAVAATVGSEPFDLLGYSLGARVALHVVLGARVQPRRLIVIGATGGIENPDDRARRRQADNETAAALDASNDVEGFIARWVSGPMFAGLSDAADVVERQRNSAAGLASSLRLCGTGTQEPLWDRFGTFDAPVLALAGTDDVRFGVHARRLAALAPNGIASLVPGGGHAAHLAQPALTARLVAHWLTMPG